MKQCVLTLFLVMVFVLPAQAATFQVTTPAELQTALTTATTNGQSDTIRVARGTYLGNFYYIPPAGENFDLVLEGGWSADFSTRTLDPANTILDGHRAGRVLWIDKVFYTGQYVSGSITVEGFTIRNGFMLGDGGGIFIMAFPPGTVTLNRNIIEENESGYMGGGFNIWNDDPTTKTGGPIHITNNIIRKNVAASAAGRSGGGGYMYTANSLLVSNNLIYGNVVGGNPSFIGHGGGLYVVAKGGDVHIVNNTITGNTAYTNGGGIGVGSMGLPGYPVEVVQLSNNIIRDNVATTGSGNDIYNTISWNPGNTLTIAHSDFHDLFTPAGTYVTPTLVNNIDAAPLFVSTADPDPLNWDLRLRAGSPCIDAGNNAAAGIPATDLEGNPRVVDGDGDATASVDMGAYESPLQPPIKRFIVDFNGDGETDIAVYRGSTGTWYVIPSGGGNPYGVVWGISTDIPVPGDYDGDRKTDYAVYRDGIWFTSPSGGGSAYAVGWGIGSDKPVPGDYDGDGKTDAAIYRDGLWFIYPSGGETSYAVGWGIATDKPVPGDYDGDGRTDVAIYRDGLWFISPSGGSAPYAVGWGIAGDKPVPGDYDGDGKPDAAVYRNGLWFVSPSGGAAPYGVGWGGDASDKPAPGDYDGDGNTDMAVYRSGTGAWYVIPSGGGAPYGLGWGGDASDVPVTINPD